MITELTIDDPNATPVKWWPKVEAFQGKHTFTFQEKGLTVLWGPNGSGKSSLLKILARVTHCEQGGTPMITDDSMRFLNDFDGWTDGVSIKTDGKPVHFLDPAAQAGLMGGGAAFDFDVGIEEGMQSLFGQQTSSGQQTTAKFNRILQSSATLEKVPSKLRGKPDPETDYGKKRIETISRATRFLERNIEGDGPPTILLDEPGRSLSIPRQAELWNGLRPVPPGYEVHRRETGVPGRVS